MPAANDDEVHEFWQACQDTHSPRQAVKVAAGVTLMRLALEARSHNIQARASLALAGKFKHRVFGPALYSELAIPVMAEIG